MQGPYNDMTVWDKLILGYLVCTDIRKWQTMMSMISSFPDNVDLLYLYSDFLLQKTNKKSL